MHTARWWGCNSEWLRCGRCHTGTRLCSRGDNFALISRDALGADECGTEEGRGKDGNHVELHGVEIPGFSVVNGMIEIWLLEDNSCREMTGLSIRWL